MGAKRQGGGQLDPDALLAVLIKKMKSKPDAFAAFTELDTWLKTGGFMPKRWARRELWIATFRTPDRTSSEESIHPTRNAAFKKICQYIYAERQTLRDVEAARTILTLMVREDWVGAAKAWRDATNALYRYTVNRAPIEFEEDVTLTVDVESVKPHK